jgi:hypothetical protein
MTLSNAKERKREREGKESEEMEIAQRYGWHFKLRHMPSFLFGRSG